MVIMTSAAFAGTNPSISALNNKSLIVDTKEWKAEFVNIEIRNEEGVIIYNDKLSTQHGKKFSFENLPTGTYAIVLSDNLKSTRQMFEINYGTLEVSPEVVTTYKPVVNITNDFIDLNYLASDKKTYVTIYDENNSIFNVTFVDNNNINKRFDTSNLPQGTYTFNVSSVNTSYSTTFNK